MRRRPLLIAAAILLVGALGVIVLTRTVGLATVHGSVSKASGLKGTRVALLQGPEVRLLVEMGVIAPGVELKFERGNTARWATVDASGEFRFYGVRPADTIVLGLSDFDDGRICQTSQSDLHPTFGSYEVTLRTPGRPCWRPSEGPHGSDKGGSR